MSVKKAARVITDALVGKESPIYTSRSGGELMEKTPGGTRTVNLRRTAKPKSGRARVTSVRKGTKYGVTPSGVISSGASPAQRARAKKPKRKVGLKTKAPTRRT